MTIHTIGHYNHTQEQFLEILKDADIDCVIDVRAQPGSNRNPHFNQDQMEDWLADAGVKYVHLPKLGGRRKLSGKVGESLNEGWENRSFHNYADYTLTDEFKQGIEELLSQAENHHVVLMCSERHPSRCHRLIISNYLQANGEQVVHLIPEADGGAKEVEHELGKWGAMPVVEADGTVVYPVVE